MAHDLAPLIPAKTNAPFPSGGDTCPYTVPPVEHGALRLNAYENCRSCAQRATSGHETCKSFSLDIPVGYGNPIPETNRPPNQQWIRYAQLILREFTYWAGGGFLWDSWGTLFNAFDYWTGAFVPNFAEGRFWDVLSASGSTVRIDTSTGTDPRAAFNGAPVQIGDKCRFSGVNCATDKTFPTIIDMTGDVDLEPGGSRPSYLDLTFNISVGDAISTSNTGDQGDLTASVTIVREMLYEDWRNIRPYEKREFFYGVPTIKTIRSADFPTGKNFVLKNASGEDAAVAAPLTFKGVDTFAVEKLVSGSWVDIPNAGGIAGASILDAMSSVERDRHNKTTHTVNIRFREEVTGLTESDFIATNCSVQASSLSTSDDISYTLVLVSSSAGDQILELPKGAAKYTTTPVAKDVSYIRYEKKYVTTGPTPEFTVNSGATASGPIFTPYRVNCSVAFPDPLNTDVNLPLRTIDPSDFTTANCEIENWAGRGGLFTFDLVPTGFDAGPVSVSLAANSVFDEAGNGNAAATLSFTSAVPDEADGVGYYPAVIPSLTSTQAQPWLTGTTFTVNCQFEVGLDDVGDPLDYPTGFTIGDVSAINATVSNFQSLGSGAYSWLLTVGEAGGPSAPTPRPGKANTASDDGSVTCYVEAGVCSNSVNSNIASNVIVREYVTKRHEATLFFIDPADSVTNDKIVRCRLETTRPVGYNIAAAFSSTNAIVEDVSGAWDRFTFSLIPVATGTASTYLPQDSLTDLAGLGNIESNTLATDATLVVTTLQVSRLAVTGVADDFAHASSVSTLYLGSTVQGVPGYDDLISDAEAIRVLYCWEAAPDDYQSRPVIVHSAICRHSLCDVSGTWGDRTNHASSVMPKSSFYCALANRSTAAGGPPSGIANYNSRCYQLNTCSDFDPVPREWFSISTEETLFLHRQLWMGNPGGLIQIVPGDSSPRNSLHTRFNHPSIWSSFTPEPLQRPPQMYAFFLLKALSHGCGRFGYEDSGDFIQGLMHDAADSSATLDGMTYPDEGVLPLLISGMDAKHNITDNALLTDTTDETSEFRRMPCHHYLSFDREPQIMPIHWLTIFQNAFPNTEQGLRRWSRLAGGATT